VVRDDGCLVEQVHSTGLAVEVVLSKTKFILPKFVLQVTELFPMVPRYMAHGDGGLVEKVSSGPVVPTVSCYQLMNFCFIHVMHDNGCLVEKFSSTSVISA
jgi:hypothetical protein